MTPTSSITSSSATPDPATGSWSTLWTQLLQAGDPSTVPGCPADDAGLGWCEREGWCLGEAASADCRDLFAAYKPMLDARRRGQAWVVAQLGVSLDGCVATRCGDSFFVSGDAALVHLHRLRALCDAVLVGAGTVAVDDPRLTTRRVPGPQPVRVVLDPAARLDGRAQVLRDGCAPTLWLCDAAHADRARARLPAGGGSDEGASAAVPDPTASWRCEVLGVSGLLDAQGRPCPNAVLEALAARGLRCVFVEGGGVTVSRFIEAGRVDRLHLIVAPVLTGTGRPGLQLPPQARMRDCPRPPARLLRLGDDVLWDLDLRAVGAWSGLPAAGDATS